MTPAVPFPGGVSVSHLRVYDWASPDGAGLHGSGTPHLHTASAEAYVVLAGAGSVQTLSSSGYGETLLRPGVVVWFTPGVVHRLVNDGGLEILVVMSNTGLPEAGDAVLTFPPDVLADVARYRAAATLPASTWPARPDGHPAADAGADDDPVVAVVARARRDLALEGYAALRTAVQRDGPAALADLHAAAARLVADRAPSWRPLWASGTAAPSTATDRALTDLAAGLAPHLAQAAVAHTAADPGPRRYGMCGRLRTWPISVPA